MSIEKRNEGWRVRWREGAKHFSRQFDLKSDAMAFEADVKRRLRLGEVLADLTPSNFAPSVARTPIDEIEIEAAMQVRARQVRMISDPMPMAQVGMTYAISSDPYDGWVKLGRSLEDPQARLNSLQVGNPRRLVLRAVWPVDVEIALHEAFDRFRGLGEWFALPLALVRDMRKFAGEEEPHRRMIEEWPVWRVWGVAGGGPQWQPERLARWFMERRERLVIEAAEARLDASLPSSHEVPR